MSPVVRTYRPSSDGVVWVRFASGLRNNRMTAQLIDEMSTVFSDLGTSDEVGTVILSSLDKDFCAGADPAVLDSDDPGEIERYVDAEYRLFETIEDAPFITVAVLDGHCLGNGAEISLACDMRIAGPRLRWGLPEARLGLMAPVARLVRHVPRGLAMQIALDGLRLDSAEAKRVGLIQGQVGDSSDDCQVRAAVGGLSRATATGARWTKAAVRDADRGESRERALAVESMNALRRERQRERGEAVDDDRD